MLGEQLSEAEYKLLCRAVCEACEHHARGDAAAGYRCLACGFERMQELAVAGETWAPAVAGSYLAALSEYSALRPRPLPR